MYIVWTVESSSRVQFLEVLSNSPLMVACLEDQQTSHPASYSWNILTSSDGSVGVALDGRLVFSSFSRTTSLSASCTVSNPVSGQNTISSRYSLSDTSSPGDRKSQTYYSDQFILRGLPRFGPVSLSPSFGLQILTSFLLVMKMSRNGGH